MSREVGARLAGMRTSFAFASGVALARAGAQIVGPEPLGLLLRVAPAHAGTQCLSGNLKAAR